MSFVGALGAFWSAYTSSEWICWGIGPALAAPVTVLGCAFALEWLTDLPWAQQYLIVYGDSESREENRRKTHEKVPWRTQLFGTMATVMGPANIVMTVLNRCSLGNLYGVPEDPLPAISAFAFDFVMMSLVGDFFLYWGHRVQHEVKFLWDNFHSYHHSVGTPSPISVAYINQVDATLQAAIPLFMCALIVGPHPVTYLLYAMFHLSNNVVNHSGMHAPLLNLITLKFLPFRVDNRHHDSHHRFSNYWNGTGSKAKNHGEMYWIWDWAFGTLSDTKKLARHQKIRGSSMAQGS